MPDNNFFNQVTQQVEKIRTQWKNDNNASLGEASAYMSGRLQACLGILGMHHPELEEEIMDFIKD